MNGAARVEDRIDPAGSIPVLQLAGLTKIFGSFAANDDISLTVDPGEVHCLLGENGAGKSTLCNMIFGIYAPTKGHMRLDGAPYAPDGPAAALNAGVAMVHQHFSLVQSLSVVDNLMLGQSGGLLKRRDFAERVRTLSNEFGLDVDPRRIVSEMSVGERQRVEIVKCLMRRPRLLLLDEPTAVLPPDEINSFLDVVQQIADTGRAIVLVTHKLAEIARVADRTTVLRAGRAVQTVAMQGIDMSTIVRAMIGRNLDRNDNAVAAMFGVTQGEAAAPKPLTPRRGTTTAEPAQADALQIDSVSYVDRSGAVRLDKITLELRRGEILGIAGVEGNGQTELGNILAGLERPASGRWFVGDREMTKAAPAAITAAGVGIVPEDRHAVGCITALSVAENLCLHRLGHFARFGMVKRAAMLEAARELMARYDVRARGPEEPFSSLSGGNQQKAVLARELTLDPLVLLVAAQPTRGLDVGAVEAVYGHIRSACRNGAAVLLISSELDELIAASDRIAVMYRGRVIGELPAEARHREAIGALMSGHAA